MIQYRTTVSWDSSLVDIGYADSSISSGLKGLAVSAIKITTGAPATNNGYFIAGAIIQNSVDGTVYQNTGTSAAAVWSLLINGASAGPTFQVKTSFTATQIKALNGSPLPLVAAPGAGKIIVPISVQGRLTFLTTAFATNTQLNVGYASGADPLFTNTTLLPVTAGAPIQPFFALAQSGVSGNDNEYVANAALNLSVPTGNPTAGLGALDVYTEYIVVTL